jgi:hypothetical protein
LRDHPINRINDLLPWNVVTEFAAASIRAQPAFAPAEIKTLDTRGHAPLAFGSTEYILSDFP